MLLTFRAGGRRRALPVGRAREVLAGADVVPLPGARRGILGILVRGGVAVPVVDLSALGGAGGGDEGDEIVVLDVGESRLGLRADDVVAAPAESGTEPSEGADAASAFLAGRVRVAGETAWLLDVESLARRLGAGGEPEENP